MPDWIGQFTAPSGLFNLDLYRKICEAIGVKDNDMLLLIIPSQMHGVPHSRYRGSLHFIYSKGPDFTGSRHDIRTFPVGLEFSCSGVCSIFENFLQDQIARPKHPRLNPFVLRLCGLSRLPAAHHSCLTPWLLISHFPTRG